MATLDQRIGRDGRSTWRARVRIKGHPGRSATFSRKTDALEWAKRTEVAVLEGAYFPHREQHRHTVADMIDLYLTSVLPHKRRNRDAHERRRCLAWWRAAIGAYRLAAVGAKLIGAQC